MVNNIAPLKTARIKNTSNEWFDKEIAEKLSIRDKLFKKLKSSHLNIDWEIYRGKKLRSKNNQTEENPASWGEIARNIAKPKELWQTLYSLGLPNNKNSPLDIYLKNKNGLLFNSLSIGETLQKILLLLISGKHCVKIAKTSD